MNQRVRLFGVEIDAVRMTEAVDRVLSWVREAAGPCRFVVTPNTDHAVMLQEHNELRAAYADASLVLADGAPVVVASKLLRRRVPERVAGSDLAPALFEAGAPLRVFLLGAAPGVGVKAAVHIEQRWPHVEVVGVHSPPLGFEHDEELNRGIIERVNLLAPDILIVGLGAPKQELWVHRHKDQLKAKAALCIGATIDFFAGHRRRAPVWMQRTGLEWLHRLCSEPRRLARRYARDAWVFPQLVWRELFGKAAPARTR